MKLMDRLAQILLEPVTKMVNGLLGSYTILWGLWVANPFVDTFTSAMLFSQLVEFMPFEWAWGLIAIFSGVLTIFGIIRRYPKPTFYGPAVAGVHWFIISIFYFMGDITNTGGITALFLSILSTYIYLNSKVNFIKDEELL